MGDKLKSLELCNEIKARLIQKTEELSEIGEKVTLASILIGEDGGAKFYTKIQKKKCEQVGVEYKLFHLKEDVTCEELRELIFGLNDDINIHGIIIQAPLPEHLKDVGVFDFITPNKDIDCQSLSNIAKLYKGVDGTAPCTAVSALVLCKWTGINLTGKNSVIIGRSNVVGKPLAQLLLNEDSTVTICHSRTTGLKEICKEADVIFSCVGRPKMIDDTYISEGAVVIDIGTSEVDGKITGDVDIEKSLGKARWISTVPGGVGPLTTMILIEKVVNNHQQFKNRA